MKRFTALAIAGLAITFAAGPAEATTWYCRAGATGKGESKDDPAGSVAAVLAEARRGDVVNVAAGEYNGPGGTGEFCVDVPNLSLVGGWNADFTERHPFKHVTILRRKQGVTTNYNKTKGGIICTDPQAHKDRRNTGCSGLIVDGFLIDGATRNVYTGSNKRLGAQGSWKESLIKLTSATPFSVDNIKIRNCILINCYNMGVEIKWGGDGNEIVNCLLVNNMMAGIDCRAAQPPMNGPLAIPGYPATKIRIANTTVAFNWVHDKAQMANGIMLGADATYTIENNVLAWLAGKFNAEGIRGAGRDVDLIRGNVFWLTSDAQGILEKQSTASQMGGGGDDDEEEEEEEEESGGSSGGGLADNVIADPGFSARVNHDWFVNFSGRAGREGQFPFDPLNEARSARDLGPITKVGQAMAPEECAWGYMFPAEIGELIPALVADQAGKGFQPEAEFATYEERLEADLPGASPGPKADYAEVDFEDLKKGAAGMPADGAKVKLKVTLRNFATRWAHQKDGFTVDKYMLLELGKPGENVSGNTPRKVFAYVVRGSQAGNRWNEYGNQGKAASTQKGVWVRGTVHHTGQSLNSQYPVYLVVDYMGKP